MLLLSSALVLGFVHGLGADHLMAIAALSLGPGGEAPAVSRARALGVAVRFAIGHAVLLALGAAALMALGGSLPLLVERGGEVLGGTLLVGLGLPVMLRLKTSSTRPGVNSQLPTSNCQGERCRMTSLFGSWELRNWELTASKAEPTDTSFIRKNSGFRRCLELWGVTVGRVYGHTHRHAHEPAARWHLHIGRPERHPVPSAHTHLPTIVGAAFAVSSLRALTMLAPFGDRVGGAPLPMLLALIGLFAVGILLSMSLFGIAFAGVMTARIVARLGRGAAGAMALASITLGVFWIANA